MRAFANSKTPKYSDPEKQIFKIEDEPELYTEIYTNEFQQKVWAQKLNIPEEFVTKYFFLYKKLKDVTEKSSTSFNPINFTSETPKEVVKEYLSSIQEDLVATYQKYKSTDQLDIVDFLRSEGIKVPEKRTDMPKFAEFEKTQLNESEKLQIEYEKDVFFNKLKLQEEALIDKIIQEHISGTPYASPLLRKEEDTFKTVESKNLDYIEADRFLHNDTFVETEFLIEAENIKYLGLKDMQIRQSEEFKAARSKSIKELNLINNALKGKILLKREILAKKLAMLDEINKFYQHKAKEENSNINRAKSYDFIEKFDNNLQEAQIKGGRDYKGNDSVVHEMEKIILRIGFGDKSPELIARYEELEKELDKVYMNAFQYFNIKMKYGIATHNSSYTMECFDKSLKAAAAEDANENISTYLPVNYPLFSSVYELCLRRDNFKGLGKLINYAIKSNLDISSLDLSLFKPSLDYYLNSNFNSNVLVFMKYFVQVHKLLFQKYKADPQKLRTLNVETLRKGVDKLMPFPNLIDMKELFGYLVNKIGNFKIIDKETKQDVMEDAVNYFIEYTVPFMDMAEYNNCFIRENDVARHFANRIEDYNSFDKIIDASIKYGDRHLFQEYMMDEILKYQHRNNGKLPESFSKENVIKKWKQMKKLLDTGKLKAEDASWDLIMLTAMKHHKMIDEMMQVPSNLQHHFVTEAI